MMIVLESPILLISFIVSFIPIFRILYLMNDNKWLKINNKWTQFSTNLKSIFFFSEIPNSLLFFRPNFYSYLSVIAASMSLISLLDYFQPLRWEIIAFFSIGSLLIDGIDGAVARSLDKQKLRSLNEIKDGITTDEYCDKISRILVTIPVFQLSNFEVKFLLIVSILFYLSRDVLPFFGQHSFHRLYAIFAAIYPPFQSTLSTFLFLLGPTIWVTIPNIYVYLFYRRNNIIRKSVGPEKIPHLLEIATILFSILLTSCFFIAPFILYSEHIIMTYKHSILLYLPVIYFFFFGFFVYSISIFRYNIVERKYYLFKDYYFLVSTKYFLIQLIVILTVILFNSLKIDNIIIYIIPFLVLIIYIIPFIKTTNLIKLSFAKIKVLLNLGFKANIIRKIKISENNPEQASTDPFGRIIIGNKLFMTDNIEKLQKAILHESIHSKYLHGIIFILLDSIKWGLMMLSGKLLIDDINSISTGQLFSKIILFQIQIYLLLSIFKVIEVIFEYTVIFLTNLKMINSEPEVSLKKEFFKDLTICFTNSNIH